MTDSIDPTGDAPEHSRGTTRRRLLGGGAAATALGAALVALPPNVRKALADPLPSHGPGSLKDIKHVVLLMQENRSFDHYSGTLSGVRGYSDPKPLTIAGGKSVFFQPDPRNPDGYLLPYHLDSHTTAAQKIPSMSHAWSVQHQAWNAGKMDNWVQAHMASDGTRNGQYTMGYFTRADIPFHYALADAFTICDNYHFRARTSSPARWSRSSSATRPGGRPRCARRARTSC